MHFTPSILLLALSTLAASAPSEKKPAPFQVTDLDIFKPTGRPDDTLRYSVSFNVSDPADGSRASCATNWGSEVGSTGWPGSYLANCTDASYAFKFVEYKGFNDFKLDVKHTGTKKPSFNKKETRFAQGQVIPYQNVRCVYSNAGFARCNQIAEFGLGVYDVRKN